MATNITKIDPDELIGMGIEGMDDAPEMPVIELQRKFDEISKDIIIPHINGMCDEIDAAVDGVADDLADEVTRARAAEHELELEIATKMTTAVYDADGNGIVDDSEKLGGQLPSYYGTSQGLADEVARATEAEAALGREIDTKMTRSVYDSNNNGVVDNSERLDGHEASHFATQGDISTLTANIAALAETFNALGLSIVNGKLCVTYNT